ncbi:GMC oxidoreductase [Tulasnella calospora MUT 4182]|nr:GMC oxidoreductase [Tulasnella calospora MUT 4182]
MTISTTLLRPTSNGTVTLKSADPWEKPLIDPCYLTTKHDMEILVRGVRLAHELANTEPLKSILDQSVQHPLLDHALGTKSNAEIEEIVRSRAETLYHPSCSARMALLEDGGVVDTRLQVYGVQGLRIVDASVQPEIVSGHTAGPTIAIAEMAADLIKEEY